MPVGNNYFENFVGFAANPTANFLTEFDRLAAHQGWSKQEKKRRRHEALEAEFDTHYSTATDKLEKWQDLCDEIGIQPTPQSITQCEKVREMSSS